MRLVPAVLFISCLIAGATTIVLTAEGYESSDCAICHEDVAADFMRTAHAVSPGWDMATGCQACHGSGDEHIDAEGDPDKIVRPQTLPPDESSRICLTCHKRNEKHFTAGQSIHGLSEVGCIDCHDAHSHSDSLLAAKGSDLCSGCHQAVAARFDLPRSHPLGGDDASCTACHDPHGSRSIRAGGGMSKEACAECHFDKTGPFLYNHDTMMVDGCTACHEVHASANRHLLRHDTQANLCYECHSASVTPGWHDASQYLGEKCTACHAAIHGSNSSQFFLEE